MFLLLKELQNMSNMYRYSLGSFIAVFKKTLNEDRGSIREDHLIQQLCNKLFENVLKYVAIGMRNKDRLTFGLYMIHGTRPELFAENEWEYFTDSIVSPERGESPPSWCPSHCLERFEKFSAIFKELIRSIDLDTNTQWKKWFERQDCENHWPQKLSEFQKVLLTKVFREDRLESCLTNFVEKALGSMHVLAPSLDLNEVYQHQSSPTTPILFIISTGSDPSNQLEEFAAKKVGKENFVHMSLGGNQNEAAMNALKSGAEAGSWVCLNNLHLVPAFLSSLEKELSGIQKHKNFRLWLTTETQDNFPAILLEACFKISYESPPGIKRNIERAYSLVDPQFLAASLVNAQTVFVLSYFHSVIQERRNFIPQGWSKYYEFSYADFIAAIKIFDTLKISKYTEKSTET
jgi:dynein heavy chain 2